MPGKRSGLVGADQIRLWVRATGKALAKLAAGMLEQRLQIDDPSVPCRQRGDEFGDLGLKRRDPVLHVHNPRSTKPRAVSSGYSLFA